MAKTSTALAVRKRSPLTPVRQLTEADLTDRSIPAIQRAQVLRHPQAMEVVSILRAIQGRPLGAKVLILPLPPDDRQGVIHLPDNAKEDQCVGIVVAVGDGHLEGGKYIPLNVYPGNFVHFSKYVSEKVKIGEHLLFQIHEQEISFIVGGPPEKEDDKAQV
jgi:co-chaperonin GroES (HSP10)